MHPRSSQPSQPSSSSTYSIHTVSLRANIGVEICAGPPFPWSTAIMDSTWELTLLMQCGGDPRRDSLSYRIYELTRGHLESLLSCHSYLGLDPGDIVISSHGVVVFLGSQYQSWSWKENLPRHPHPSYAGCTLCVSRRSGLRWTTPKKPRRWNIIIRGTKEKNTLASNAHAILCFLHKLRQSNLGSKLFLHQSKVASQERLQRLSRSERLSSADMESWAIVERESSGTPAWIVAPKNHDAKYALRDDLQDIALHFQARNSASLPACTFPLIHETLQGCNVHTS
jgi:hypothetical protein